MDVMRALKFPFDDDDWLMKIIIGTLLSFIPFFALGYQVRVARNVMRGKRRILPDNNELGQVFTDGLMATIAALIYFLPLILVVCVFLVPAVAVGDNDLGFMLMCFTLACVFVLGLLYTIPASGLYWMGVIRYAETGDFMEFFRLSALWGDLWLYMGMLLTLWVYSLVLGLVFAFIAPVVAITVIGAPLLGFYHQLATGHLIGQTGREIISQER